jgi:hypothetical protein
VFDLKGERDGAFGFNFGGLKCTGSTTRTLYKDYNPNTASGTCVVLQRPPADATGTGGRDEPGWIEEEGGSGESC